MGVNFSWRGQYLVMLEGDSCGSPHGTGRFICDGDQSPGQAQYLVMLEGGS